MFWSLFDYLLLATSRLTSQFVQNQAGKLRRLVICFVRISSGCQANLASTKRFIFLCKSKPHMQTFMYESSPTSLGLCITCKFGSCHPSVDFLNWEIYTKQFWHGSLTWFLVKFEWLKLELVSVNRQNRMLQHYNIQHIQTYVSGWIDVQMRFSVRLRIMFGITNRTGASNLIQFKCSDYLLTGTWIWGSCRQEQTA